MTIRGFFFTAAALAGLASASAGYAGERAPADAPPSARVTYADLNISNPADAKVLMLRLKRAAAEVCGYWSETWNQPLQGAVRRCMTDAVDGAMTQIDHTQIAAGKPGARSLLVAQVQAPSRSR